MFTHSVAHLLVVKHASNMMCVDYHILLHFTSHYLSSFWPSKSCIVWKRLDRSRSTQVQIIDLNFSHIKTLLRPHLP